MPHCEKIKLWYVLMFIFIGITINSNTGCVFSRLIYPSMSDSGSTTFFQLIYGYLKIYLRFVTGKFSIQASQKLLYEEEHQ